jgi:transposase
MYAYHLFMWYVGLDAHLDTSAVSIRNGKGVITARFVVPTTRVGLKQALRGIRGRTQVLCESGPLAPWIRDALETRFREVVVCNRRRTRLTTSGAKTDRIDADRLSDLSRRGEVATIHVPRGDAARLRRYAFHYARMLRERSRILQRLQALFFEHALRVRTHRSAPERVPLRRLTAPGARYVARAYLQQLHTATLLVAEARASLIALAQQWPEFDLLQTVPYVGEVRASMLVAFIGDPRRFSVRAFWSYGGLGVVQKLSSEHRVEHGKAVREERARGMRLRPGQPLLKKVLKDIALHASIGRGGFRAAFDAHIARGKSPAIARTALARKIAAVILAVWRTGTPFCEATMAEG